MLFYFVIANTFFAMSLFLFFLELFMFKKSLLALSLMSLSGAAFCAAPVANLKISGSITPPTCTINGQTEDTFIYDFDISPGIFPAAGNLTLDAKSQNIEVICDATTYLTFSSADDRTGSELTAGNNNFGLGTYDTNTKIGFYTVKMENATVKANTSADATSVGVVSGSNYATSALVDKTQKLGWATSASQLAAGQIFAADFAVTPTINGAMKNSSGDAQLDGFAVLTFAFGV